MSTNSRIAIENLDGTIKSVYCHWDGYPSHHVPILTQKYETQEKAEALIELGDLSELNEDLESTVAYCRDRDEEFNQDKHENLTEFLRISRPKTYVFSNGCWNMVGSGDKLVPVDIKKYQV